MSTHSFRLATLAVIGVAATIVGTGLSSRWSHARQLNERAVTMSVPAVAVISPSSVQGEKLSLPGRIEAWTSAPIHARVNGYLTERSVDIGDSVKVGQTLARIDNPELDQQLQQVRAELVAAQSQATLAASNAQRWQSLLPGGAVSRQAVDERVAAQRAAASQVHSLQANVQRVQSLLDNKVLTAPFDGIVTARNTDVGALINAGTGNGNELFVISNVRRLRVYVTVPQRQVASLAPGAKALLTVPEKPGETYEAVVQSLSQAIEARSGGMLVQLVVDNADGNLLPGGFAAVQFESTQDAQVLGVPPSALIINRSGVQIATLGDDNRVLLRSVTIARDFGYVVELVEALDARVRIIDSPPESLSEGDRVRVAAGPTTGAGA